MHNLQLLQLGVDALDGEAHHIVVAAIKTVNDYYSGIIINPDGKHSDALYNRDIYSQETAWTILRAIYFYVKF